MMRIFAVLAFITVASSQLLLNTFNNWVTSNGITFDNQLTEQISRSNFLNNVQTVVEYNSNVVSNFVLELNEFADLSLDEFLKLRTGLIVPEKAEGKSQKVGGPFGDYDETNAPEEAFFLEYMQPVLDQGLCGSCWAFATMSQVEAMMKIRDTSYDTQLSPQYLVDCDWREFACQGGWPTRAMNWLRAPWYYKGGQNKAPSLENYSYKGRKDVCHKYFTNRLNLDIKNVYEIVPDGNERQMMAVLANNGPVAIAVEVTETFQLYKSGILEDPTMTNDCSSVNHAVVLVGYGSDEDGMEYWLIKNSWSEAWGEDGYIRIARNKGNQFSVACYAMFVQ